jgi:hypothetical protein
MVTNPDPQTSRQAIGDAQRDDSVVTAGVQDPQRGIVGAGGAKPVAAFGVILETHRWLALVGDGAADLCQRPDRHPE